MVVASVCFELSHHEYLW